MFGVAQDQEGHFLCPMQVPWELPPLSTPLHQVGHVMAAMTKRLGARGAVPLPSDAASALAAEAVARLYITPSATPRLEKNTKRLTVFAAFGRAAAERSLAALLRALRKNAAAAIDDAASAAAAACRARLLSSDEPWNDEDVLVAAWDAKGQEVTPGDAETLRNALDRWARHDDDAMRGAAAAPLLSALLDLLDILHPTAETPIPASVLRWVQQEAPRSAGRALYRRACDRCALPAPPPPPKVDSRGDERPQHVVLMDLLAQAKAEPFVKELRAGGGMRARETAAGLRADPPRAENPVLDIGIDWGAAGLAEEEARENVAATRRAMAHALLLLEDQEDLERLEGNDALCCWSNLHLVEDTLALVLAADARGEETAAARLRVFVHRLATDVNASLPPRFLARVRPTIERFAGEAETVNAALDSLGAVAEVQMPTGFDSRNPC